MSQTKPTAPSTLAALKDACDHLGSQAALAFALGIRAPSLAEWIRAGRCPLERAPEIERVTEGRVRCEALRPDVDWHRDDVTGLVTGYHVPLRAAG